MTVENVLACTRPASIETRCDRAVTHVHLLPHEHLARPPERAVLACREHEPGGVWFALRDWRSLREHYLARKVHGLIVVELVDVLLADERQRTCAGWSAAPEWLDPTFGVSTAVVRALFGREYGRWAA